jgi:hypothetical protein
MHLHTMIEKYLRHSGTPPTRFGREAVGDPRFVLDLRNGGEPREITAQKVVAYMTRQLAERGR